VSSADVAADFEDSLKDLGANNRYEISNLTIIAKESTEHAEAISNVLENHIKNVRSSAHTLVYPLGGTFADLVSSSPDIALTKTPSPLCVGQHRKECGNAV
jgi:pre-mRNA cleavage complex 2 protein Pcf11